MRNRHLDAVKYPNSNTTFTQHSTISVAVYGFYSKLYNSSGSLLSCTVHYSTEFSEWVVCSTLTAPFEIVAQ